VQRQALEVGLVHLRAPDRPRVGWRCSRSPPPAGRCCPAWPARWPRPMSAMTCIPEQSQVAATLRAERRGPFGHGRVEPGCSPGIPAYPFHGRHTVGDLGAGLRADGIAGMSQEAGSDPSPARGLPFTVSVAAPGLPSRRLTAWGSVQRFWSPSLTDDLSSLGPELRMPTHIGPVRARLRRRAQAA
jgi:hypothetical protein